MIFTTLKYKNILSTGNQWTEVQLNKSKTTLIVGDNGSGKSTILDALSFVLFNKPFRPDLTKPQLLNSINNKGLVVEVEFSVGKKEYKIIRGIKPAIFEVYEDNTLLNQDANARDYQDYLEKQILKANHRAFTQIVMLGSASYTPFMRLPPQYRREVVEEILDLKIFGLMNSLLYTKRQQNEAAISENASDKKLLTQKVELIKQHNEHLTSSNNKMIDDKKERIKNTDCNIITAETDITQLNLAIKEFEQSIQDVNQKETLQKELTQIKYKLETKIANLAKGIDFFHQNENCPTCSQEIDPEFKCDIIIKKKLASDEAADGLIKVNSKLEKVNERLNEIKQIRKNITDLALSIHSQQNTIYQLKKYIDELESEIELMKSHNKEIDKDELVRLNEQLSDISITYNKLITRKNMLDLAGILLKDSGIKAKIIKQYIPIINKLINKYLSMLDFFVQFTINERFEEKILSRFRDEYTYGSFSEGEKFRINIAILFTWRAVAKLRNSINTNILFLDEILDSALDLSGTDDFLKILNQTDVENIFILSPKSDHLFDKFENILRFTKYKNFSKMEST